MCTIYNWLECLANDWTVKNEGSWLLDMTPYRMWLNFYIISKNKRKKNVNRYVILIRLDSHGIYSYFNKIQMLVYGVQRHFQ